MVTLTTSEWGAFARGAALSGSLIIAIGAQNAHVLRQGLRRAHVLATVLTCTLSDALLVGLGVAGAGAALGRQPWLFTGVRWAGAAYLAWFGLSAIRRALRPGALVVDEAQVKTSRAVAVGTTLALTYLNPHVYLDVLLIGSVGAREVPEARVLFAAGAIAVSVGWFFALGYGARLLGPLFARPAAWRALDGGIAVIVLAMAVTLLRASPSQREMQPTVGQFEAKPVPSSVQATTDSPRYGIPLQDLSARQLVTSL